MFSVITLGGAGRALDRRAGFFRGAGFFDLAAPAFLLVDRLAGFSEAAAGVGETDGASTTSATVRTTTGATVMIGAADADGGLAGDTDLAACATVASTPLSGGADVVAGVVVESDVLPIRPSMNGFAMQS